MRNVGIYLGLLAAFVFANDRSSGQAVPAVPAVVPANPAGIQPVNPITPQIPRAYPVGQPGAAGYVPPIFKTSQTPEQDIANVNGVVNRAINLGNVTINTKKIADVLDRGIPTGPGTPGDQAKKKVGDDTVLLAGGDPKATGKVQPVGGDPRDLGKVRPAGNQPNGQDDGYKQTTEEMNRIFRMQADLLRSIDVSGVYRQGWNGNGFSPNFNPNCPNGQCGPDACYLILTGRTGLALTLLAPQSQDVLNVPREQGLYVKGVFPKTPADLAGFKANDVLIEFDGKKVPGSYAGFLNEVFKFVKNDTSINAVVLRNNVRVELNGMKITDSRVVPPLVNECQLETYLPQIIQVVPGINSAQASSNVVREIRELRSVVRPGGITDFIWVTVPATR